MSNLYIATDLTQSGATRVIKEMTARYSDPNEQKMAENLFMREAQLLATLNHPHIPKVFDKFIFQGKYYLSMEYVQGDDLGKLIQDRGTIEEKWVAAWGAQMATVLYYLHRQNPPIVFRDVKPSNIMIVQDQVKLIDFGIARLFTSAKKGDTMRIGSPGYAPPEQYGGQTDPRSDIYALGVTLHHAATGHDPTVSQTPFVIPPARSLNPRVSVEMEALISRATQLDPDKRYQNCLDMKRDLQNVMRMHGMVVGASMPFSALQAATPAAAPAAPPPGATVPKLPPSAAAAAMAAAAPVAVAAAAVSAVSPSASPTPGPAAANPQANTATPAPAPRRKRSLAPLFLIFSLVALTVGALKAPPQWRDAAWQQVQTWLSGLQFPAKSSAPQLSDAQKVVLWGGPIGLAAEELGKEARLGKATAEQALDYQNALAYASGRPLRPVVVVAPAEMRLAETLAFWQRQSWEDTGREGALTVLALIPVKDNWRSALKQATSGECLRQGVKAQAVLVVPPKERPPGWSSWFKEVPQLYWGGPRSEQDPPQARNLEVEAPDRALLLRNAGLGTPTWMAKEPPAPSGVSAADFPSAEGLARLLKSGEGERRLLVVDRGQLEVMVGWPKLNGVDLITFLEPEQVRGAPPKAPAGARLYALSSGHPFCEYPVVRAYFSQSDLVTPVYDRLGWVVLRPDEDGPRTGLSWRSDRSGNLLQPHWSLLEARNGSWCWVKEVEARP